MVPPARRLLTWPWKPAGWSIFNRPGPAKPIAALKVGWTNSSVPLPPMVKLLAVVGARALLMTAVPPWTAKAPTLASVPPVTSRALPVRTSIRP